MNKHHSFWLVVAVTTLLFSCLSHKEKSNQVEMNPTFIDRIMPELGKGVTGGDGSISIDLKDGRSLFMWGDCFIGDVIQNRRSPETSALVVGNIFTVLSKDTVISYYQGTREKPTSWLTPEPMSKDTASWYWPGSGFVRDGIIHLFMTEFYRSGEGMFDFKFIAVAYFRLDAKTLKTIDKVNFPAANINGVHYGGALYDDGNYAYLYGTQTDSNGFAKVHIARAELTNNKLTNWRYCSHGKWMEDPVQSTPITGIKTSVSEQFNVFKLENRYILVTQTRDAKNQVFSALADKPEGPFYNEKKIFEVTEPLREKKMMTYNTMVHPQYMDKGRILMCYNVNTSAFFDLYKDATLYKPRFFWMPLDNLLK